MGCLCSDKIKEASFKLDWLEFRSRRWRLDGYFIWLCLHFKLKAAKMFLTLSCKTDSVILNIFFGLQLHWESFTFQQLIALLSQGFLRKSLQKFPFPKTVPTREQWEDHPMRAGIWGPRGWYNHGLTKGTSPPSPVSPAQPGTTTEVPQLQKTNDAV